MGSSPTVYQVIAALRETDTTAWWEARITASKVWNRAVNAYDYPVKVAFWSADNLIGEASVAADGTIYDFSVTDRAPYKSGRLLAEAAGV